MNNLYLCHHGIAGQKWGVRRYQNKDGSLTPEGRKRLFGAGHRHRKSFSKKYEAYKTAQAEYKKSGKLSDKLKAEMYQDQAERWLGSVWQAMRVQSALRFDGEALKALNRGSDWADAFMEDYRKYGVN